MGEAGGEGMLVPAVREKSIGLRSRSLNLGDILLMIERARVVRGSRQWTCVGRIME